MWWELVTLGEELTTRHHCREAGRAPVLKNQGPAINGDITCLASEVGTSCHHLLCALWPTLSDLPISSPLVYLPSSQVLISLNCWEHKIVQFSTQEWPGFLTIPILTNDKEHLLSVPFVKRGSAEMGKCLELGSHLASDSFCRATKAHGVGSATEMYCFTVLGFWDQGFSKFWDLASSERLWRILPIVTRYSCGLLEMYNAF